MTGIIEGILHTIRVRAILSGRDPAWELFEFGLQIGIGAGLVIVGMLGLLLVWWLSTKKGR